MRNEEFKAAVRRQHQRAAEIIDFIQITLAFRDVLLAFPNFCSYGRLPKFFIPNKKIPLARDMYNNLKSFRFLLPSGGTNRIKFKGSAPASQLISQRPQRFYYTTFEPKAVVRDF